MWITERLDVEHRLFLRQLDDVAELVCCGAAPQAWQGAARTVARVLDRHFSLEEQLVFPALIAARPEWAGLVAELEGEHRRLERLARDAERDPTGATVRELVDLMHQHAEKETCVAFPLAEEALPPARLRTTPVEPLAGPPAPRQRLGSDWSEYWLG